jgi:diguanylate cyclase (GGDEF)-like protein
MVFFARSSPKALSDGLPASDQLALVDASALRLGSLASELEGSSGASVNQGAYESRLVEVRLGMASCLFAALRHKHSPTAAHSLRVALGCSSWAYDLELDTETRDELEVAALLHDVGKIGAPDRLLLHAGPLAAAETLLMDQHRLSGLDMLATCSPSPAINQIIRYSGGWYDGSRANYPLAGERIPVGARMLAIVDAFDSMTSGQVYRPAMSRERALNELFNHAGTQFDPELVKQFGGLKITTQLHSQVIAHWLETFDPAQSNRFWQSLRSVAPAAAALTADALFQQKLLDNMHDAVIFVDENLRIKQWNRGAERLTGIPGVGVLERLWSPSLIGMRDEMTGALSSIECPVAHCVVTGVQSMRRLLVASRDGRPTTVDVHVVPVIGPDGISYGATLLMHDASPQISLEERCQSLHEKATKDPLTQVANRAEFDRTLALFVQAHVEQQLPCSLVICDIDHFKSINDTYGHQAGDEVLKLFGQMLKGECRQGDMVARYGGEEFVLLCADCNNATAAGRAEHLRRAVADICHPVLNGANITVSFGVTEIQAGDTPDSMLRRADRALFEAKRMGRNMVVQLGGGLVDEVKDSNHAPVQHSVDGEFFVDRVLATAVPLNLAVEKLRGFVLDHHAEILSIKVDRVELQMDVIDPTSGRRNVDRRVPFLIDLKLAEKRVPIFSSDGRSIGQVSRTLVQVRIRMKRVRDRRTATFARLAGCILTAIRSYLMAVDEQESPEGGSTRPVVNVLAPWLKLRT